MNSTVLILRAVVGALCVLVCGVGAMGQERFGPPTLTELATAPSPLTPLIEAQADAMNPLAALAAAGAALPGRDETPTGGKGNGLSTALNIVVVLTVISLAPSIMLMTTCFMRIIVVLGLLKQALGTQQLPPAQVITGLALVMTMIVMGPDV